MVDACTPGEGCDQGVVVLVPVLVRESPVAVESAVGPPGRAADPGLIHMRHDAG